VLAPAVLLLVILLLGPVTLYGQDGPDPLYLTDASVVDVVAGDVESDMTVVDDLTRPGGDYDDPHLQIRGTHMLPRLQKTVRRAQDRGVSIVAGVDTGYGPESVIRIGHELEQLAGAGLSPQEALQAATTTAAEMLRMEERTGRVAEGLEADLVVVDRNPLRDITNVQDVLVVVSNGQVAVNRLPFAMVD